MPNSLARAHLVADLANARTKLLECQIELATAESILASIVTERQASFDVDSIGQSERAYRASVEAWSASVAAYQADIARCEAEIAAQIH